MRDLSKAIKIRDIVLNHLGDQVERVVLFGSYARGEEDEHSDVDLAVFGNFHEKDRVKRNASLRVAIASVDVTKDILTFTPEEFEKFFFKEAVLEEGIILYER